MQISYSHYTSIKCYNKNHQFTLTLSQVAQNIDAQGLGMWVYFSRVLLTMHDSQD